MYVCNWCEFIRGFGMVEALADVEKEILEESKVVNDEVFECEHLENLQALSDLED